MRSSFIIIRKDGMEGSAFQGFVMKGEARQEIPESKVQLD